MRKMELMVGSLREYRNYVPSAKELQHKVGLIHNDSSLLKQSEPQTGKTLESRKTVYRKKLSARNGDSWPGPGFAGDYIF